MQVDQWFRARGAYILVDGQYGSTGKGLFAAYIAEKAEKQPNWITTNAGPNSGHTAYYQGRKIVTQQLPVSAVIHYLTGPAPRVLLNAGAIIDLTQLRKERDEFVPYHNEPYIHPCAVVINDDHREKDAVTRSAIASTGKGTGPALMSKIGRIRPSLARDFGLSIPVDNQGRTWDNFWNWTMDTVFVETAQGFSLGVHSTMYPHVTSRECTVMQALADARIPAQVVRQVAMTVRTFPIRVGNTENHSGAHYADQEETTWEAIGVQPEYTTVTNRMRRVFTWSRQQFRDALAANRPDVLFVNFMQYLPHGDRAQFVQNLFEDCLKVVGGRLPKVYYGYGPRADQVVQGR